MKISLIAIPLLGLASLLLGVRQMDSFDMTAGETGTAPASWPSGSPLVRRAGGPTLLVFAHPQCKCTEATIKELREILFEADNPIDTRVFFEPEGQAEARLWDETALIPRTTVAWDKEGEEAKRFGARTSGTVVLYSESGRLLFHGGITAARGHEGANRGAETLLASLLNKNRSFHKFPVFGCALGEPR